MNISENDLQALAGFRYGLRKFLRFSKDYLADQAKVTPEQYEALLALKAFSSKEGLLIGELSERLQVRHHTAVSLIDRLSKRKLVTRHRGTRDRRTVQVRLTRSGEELIDQLAVGHRGALAQLIPELITALQNIAD
jgi:DNA-binding MarR family transcriptional regulator